MASLDVSDSEITIVSASGARYPIKAEYAKMADTIKGAMDMDPTLKEFKVDEQVQLTDNALRLAVKYMNHHKGRVFDYVPFMDVKLEFDPDNPLPLGTTEKRTCTTRWTHPGHYFKYRTDLYMDPRKNRLFAIKDIYSWDAYFISHIGPTLRILYDLAHCAHYLGIKNLLQLFGIHMACTCKGLESEPDTSVGEVRNPDMSYLGDYMSGPLGLDVPIRRFSGNLDYDLDLMWPVPADFTVDESTYMYENEPTFQAEVARRTALLQKPT
jgi:hypothetical protein